MFSLKRLHADIVQNTCAQNKCRNGFKVRLLYNYSWIMIVPREKLGVTSHLDATGKTVLTLQRKRTFTHFLKNL